jgi:peptide/nickel transport system permease protein
MTAYIIRRLVSVIPVLFVVATVLFLIIHLSPGDPAEVMLGNEASEQSVATLRHQLGLDQPLPVQLVNWYGRVLRLDLGRSIYSDKPVVEQIARNWQPTFLLTLLAVVFAVLVGVPLGVLAATHQSSFLDKIFMMVATMGISVPSFWLGLNLIVVFSLIFPLLPSQGFVPPSQGVWAALRHLILPAAALGLPQIALIARMTRSSMLEVLSLDYVRTARAKGVAEWRVVYGHALRNTMIPTVTVIGLSFAILLGGAVIIEQVFNIPGLGTLIVASVIRRDYAVVQGTVLLVTGIYVLINLCIDLLYAFLDPRIRYQ